MSLDLLLLQSLLVGEIPNYSIQKRYIRKDGTTIWVNLTLSLVRDPAGVPKYNIGVIQDISERKQAEKALYQSQQLLQLVMDSIPQAIFWKDAHSVYLGCNRKFVEDCGFQQLEDVAGKTDWDLFSPEQAESFIARDRQVMTTNTPIHRLTEQVTLNNGKQAWLETSKIPLLDGDGSVMGILGTYEDITERKQALDALKLSEAREREKAQREELFNRLTGQIRNSLDLNTILETCVSEIRTLLEIDRCSFAWYRPFANPPIWQILKESSAPELSSLIGVYPVTIIGKATENLVKQKPLCIDDLSKFSDPFERRVLLSMGYKSVLCLPIQTPAGEIGVLICGRCYSPQAWSKSEVELLSSVASQLAIAINQADLYAQTCETARLAKEQTQQLEQTLFELKKTQAQLINSEKMSSLGQLVAGVAHEINNPVNFIYGNLIHAKKYVRDLLQLLHQYRSEYLSPSPELAEVIEDIELDYLMEDLPHLLNSMEVGADRIREIVLSLRNFSRLDEAEMKYVDIHTGIDSTLMILQSRLKPKAEWPAINIVKVYGNLPNVECYAGQLNQVFMNILTNAIDALEERDSQRSFEEIMQNPSQITIQTEMRQEAIERISWVMIRIGDNGPGMTEKVKQKLFNPFFTTKPVGKGTGLGLAISYQIVVERHRGKLLFSSQAGQGTEFIIEIPVRQRG